MIKFNKVTFLMLGSAGILSSLYAYKFNYDYLRGLYGDIQFLYINDWYETIDRRNKSFIQIYELGYEDYIYSPKLLKYDISTTFYLENTDITDDDGNRHQNITNQDYKAYLNFIQKTKYPFTLYAEKRTVPTLNLGNYNYYINHDYTKYGIKGRVDLGYNTNIRYNAEKRETNTQGLFSDETIKTDNISFLIENTYQAHYTSLYFQHQNIDYQRVDYSTDYQSDRIDRVNEVRLSHKWRPPKGKLRVNSYIYYSDNDYYDFKRTTLSSNAYWTPSKRYRLNFGLYGENLDERNLTTTYVSLFANGRYRLSPQLTALHNLQYYTTDNDIFSQDISTATVGLNYKKNLKHGFSYFINNDLGIRVERGEGQTQTESRTLNKDVKLYNMTTGITKRYPKNMATASLTFRYNYLSSDLGDEMIRYTTTATFNTKVKQNMHYNLTISYSDYYNRVYTGYEDDEYSSGDYYFFSLTNRFNYQQSFSLNGKFALSTGVRYTESNVLQELSPFVNSTFYYRLYRGLIFNARADIAKDLYVDAVNYYTYAGINYRIRKLLLAAGIRYANQYTKTDHKNERQNFFVKVERKF